MRVFPINGTERGGPMTPATARKLIARAGELAKLPFPIHPHMLRHSAGYKLSDEGHDTRSIQQYLGHKNVTHTVRYTELSPEKAKKHATEVAPEIQAARQQGCTSLRQVATYLNDQGVVT